MRIYSPSKNEASVIVDLLDRQFKEHQIEVSSFQLATSVATLLDNSSLGFFLLALQESHTVGLACVSFCWTLEHGGKSAWLDELYVLPGYRSRGVGSALIEAVFREATAQGCTAIDLEVDIEHSRAEQLYQRFGFEPLERSRWVRKFR